jgi:GTP-binding protein HflX
VLEEIGIQRKDTLLVINKVDAMPDRMRLDALLSRYPSAVGISAKTGFGLPLLSVAVADALSHTFRDVDVEMGVDNGRMMAYLAAHGEVLSKTYVDSRVVLHCRLPAEFLGRIHEDSIVIRPHGNDLGSALMEDVA